MNEFARCRRDCFIGIKAFHNIRASLLAFERLLKLHNSKDYFLLSSVFSTGVIRYVKPFLNSKTDTSLVAYPIKHLKASIKFSVKMHEHLKEVRNALIAHDDFEYIEPRLLSYGMTLRGTDVHVPVTIMISNKCISHPSDLDGVGKIKEHVASALEGVARKLDDDIKKFRSIKIENPEQAKELQKYSESYGHTAVPEGGTRLQPPDFANNSWLDPIEPDFSEIHNGFRYEKITVKQEFHGPEVIKLPTGDVIEINPS